MRLTFPDVVFWTSVVLCAVAQVAILRSVLLVRHVPPAGAPAGVPPVRRAVETVWAVVPAVALAVLLALTWRAIHPAGTRGPAAPLSTVLSPASLPASGVPGAGAA
jgi:heme/copper-type cytochrome/quinol oxidase subunit 2